MNTLKYILVNKQPVIEPDLEKWASWFEDSRTHIALTELEDCKVSTIFLGIDYSYGEQIGPLLFETMIFGGEYDRYKERYRTYDAAERGHIMAVEMVTNSHRLREIPDYIC